MLKEPTMEKLTTMKLTGMMTAWEEQQEDPKLQKLSFDERLGMLVEAEWTSRETRRLERALRTAKLKLSQACVEDVECGPRRGLERPLLSQLRKCRWVQEHQNIVITGATGTGKTYVGCALAHQACRHGHKALYKRAVRLFDELHLAKAAGTYTRALTKIARIDVLVIDDWALTPIREQERQDLLEVLEDRYGTKSTIIIGQLPPNKWHAYIKEPTIADAICDRVLHNAHRIVLKGPSRRKEATSKK